MEEIISYFLCLDRSTFYARKQNASRVFATVWASVGPSVRLARKLSAKRRHIVRLSA